MQWRPPHVVVIITVEARRAVCTPIFLRRVSSLGQLDSEFLGVAVAVWKRVLSCDTQLFLLLCGQFTPV